MKILVAEDDTELLDVTVYSLRKHGYDVTTAIEPLTHSGSRGVTLPGSRT